MACRTHVQGRHTHNAFVAPQTLLPRGLRLRMHSCCTAAPRLHPFPGGNDWLQGPLAAELWDLHNVRGTKGCQQPMHHNHPIKLRQRWRAVTAHEVGRQMQGHTCCTLCHAHIISAGCCSMQYMHNAITQQTTSAWSPQLSYEPHVVIALTRAEQVPAVLPDDCNTLLLVITTDSSTAA